jgi:membrane protease YdiL (CAAX protease family)
LSNLYRNNAVSYSLVWLGIYLVLNTITGNVAAAMEIDSDLVSAIPNLALAVICFCVLKRAGIAAEIGLLTKPAERASVMLYYLPMLALPFLNLAYGINTSLSVVEVVSLFAMYSGVGFMEEIIFRGIMFKGLTKKWNRYVVVAFISLTFAVGHIVSMVAVGQSGTDTVLQILNAFVVGLMFMAVMLASGNLTICVIAHILYNFLANISLVRSTRTEVVVITTAITVLYFGYLIARAKQVKAYFGGRVGAGVAL